MSNKILTIITLLIVLITCISCPLNTIELEAQITSFKLLKNNNASISEDIIGIIDEESKTISVPIPDSVTVRNSLKATIITSIGDTKEEVFDLSTNPNTYTVYSKTNIPVVYMINVTKEYPNYPNDALIISEYYCGNAYTMKGDNNQYIELTNLSSDSIDLGAYQIEIQVFEDGNRLVDKDYVTNLSGTVAAGESFVFYSNRSTLVPSCIKKATDKMFNSFVRFSGYSTVSLLNKGNKVDVVGSGDGRSWGLNRIYRRKLNEKPTTTWNEYDWLVFESTNSASDISNAGIQTEAVSDDSTEITYFGFDDVTNKTTVSIDPSNHTINVQIRKFDLLPSKVLKPSIGTKGKVIKYNGQTFLSGKTEIDFSTSPKNIVVVANNNSSVTYKISVKDTVSDKVTYTTTNYNFDGGIKEVLDAIIAGGETETSFTAKTVTGILTAKKIFGYSGYEECFFIQDKNAGIYVYNGSSLPSGVKIGNKISFSVNAGKVYFNMPEITGIGNITIVDGTVNPIYYKTGNYNNAENLGKVFMYEGSILSAASGSYLKGQFTSALYFRVLDAIQEEMSTGLQGKFYGPINYYRDNYTMEISEYTQIVE